MSNLWWQAISSGHVFKVCFFIKLMICQARSLQAVFERAVRAVCLKLFL